jgi:hypothetical protein
MCNPLEAIEIRSPTHAEKKIDFEREEQSTQAGARR